MIFRIPRGKHRARPLRFGIWWRKNSFAWMVKFDESCRYDLGNEDQFDTNKLCGIGYLPGHHTDSARFGWRYWTDLKQIELTAYCYVRGRRVIKHICFCEIGKVYRLRLQVLAAAYYFDVYEPDQVKSAGIVTVERFHEKKLKYRLGPYFGGNQVAPHEIKIELSKL
jgi:hypothetical protein